MSVGYSPSLILGLVGVANVDVDVDFYIDKNDGNYSDEVRLYYVDML